MEKQTTGKNSYIENRAKEIPVSTVELFTNPFKSNLYQNFKNQYSGEPSGTEMPLIKRLRGNNLLEYQHIIFSAMTTDGRHLVHIRRSFGSSKGGIKEPDRYFAVTMDTEIGQPKEWLVDNIKISEPHEPQELAFFMLEDSRKQDPSTMVFSYKNSRAYILFDDSLNAQTFISTKEIEDDFWILNKLNIPVELTSENYESAA